MKELLRKIKIHAFFSAVVVFSALSFVTDKLKSLFKLSKKTVALALLSVLVFSLVLLSGCRGGFFSGMPGDLKKVRNTENVYDEIWNCAYEEYAGKSSVLTGASSGGRRSVDLGTIQGVNIDKYHVSLRFADNGKKLSISFYDSGFYTYDASTKTLTGNKDEQYITDNFIKYYFEWNDKSQIFSSNYSDGNLGEYTYENSEY